MEVRAQTPVPLFAAALLAPLVVSAGLAGLRDQVPAADAALVLVLVVVAVSVGGSRAAGIVAALSATVWFDFFLTKPYETFSITRSQDIQTAVLLVASGVIVTEIALWGRRQQAGASRREGYLTGVVGAAAMVAEGTAEPAAVLDFVSRQVVEVLGIDECVFVAGRPGAGPTIGHDGSVTRDGRVLDIDRSGLPTDNVIELPVSRGGEALGHFRLKATSHVVWTTREQRLVAVALADQAAAAAASVG